MKKLVLSYIGNDSFNRPVYEDATGKLFVDTNPCKHQQARICTKLNNVFDGEPDTPIEYIKMYVNMEIEFYPQRITW